MSNSSESTISQLLTHTDRYDCALITAFRKYDRDGNGRRYTEKENAQRNASLCAKLTAGFCEMAVLRGSYSDRGEVTRDRFFFVVNRGWGVEPTPFYRFMYKIRRFGREFDQDAVLMIPKGSTARVASRHHVPETAGSKQRGHAFFIRTNEDPENWMKVQDLMRATVDEPLLKYAVGDFLNIVSGFPLQIQPKSENQDCSEVKITDVHYLPGNLSTMGLVSRAGRRPWREADSRWLRGSQPPEDYSRIFG